MYYKQTTQVPNELIEAIPTLNLSGAQVKLLLIFYRSTWGWHKKRDRITYSQLAQKSGLGHRVIASSIQTLIDKNLLIVTNYKGYELRTPQSRRGKMYLFYTPIRIDTSLSYDEKCTLRQKQVQKASHNKTNVTKPIEFQNFMNQGVRKFTDRERYEQIIYERSLKYNLQKGR